MATLQGYFMLDTVRVTESDSDLLVRLKRSTGIRNWNVLCRWGFCLSLRDPDRPHVDPRGAWSSIEMTWKVFGGPYSSIYWAALQQRYFEDCRGNNAQMSDEGLEQEFYRHLHRGIGHLANIAQRPTLDDIMQLVGPPT